MTVAALIVAAGKGERAGGDVPKQFQTIGGLALIAHAFDSFVGVQGIDHIIIVIGPGQQAQLQTALNDRVPSSIIVGGQERQHSVKNGLDAAESLGADKVLIHDAARPFVPLSVLKGLLQALEVSAGAVPVLPVVDTLAHGDAKLGAPVDRSELFRIQTPQAFHLDAIMTSHKRWTGGAATDDAQMARAAGYDVALVPGSADLEKITQSGDLSRIEGQWMQKKVSRTGMGFDVHRLELGEELWLCGVLVPHDKGLAGHSDADVALHALTDAILGAIAEGDIGTHFPPSDPQWKGAVSSRFLEHARDLVRGKGGEIVHVDLTIICEEPKIGPHRAAMRAKIANLLQLELSQVSVKATTTERLGFTGREEGIAAQAVATILL